MEACKESNREKGVEILNNEPILVIMAAGMGSRYGGLKQMEPVGSGGELIIDFSIYDAMMAGFKKVVFIIKKEIEEDFKALIEGRSGKFLDMEYAYQELSDIPKEVVIPPGREKPWGTCHAVLAARNLIDSPFAVINADDYYGADAFHKMYEFLISGKKVEGDCCMIGYNLGNTLSDSGHVARGVCEATPDGFLARINERTKIMRREGKIMFTEDDEKTWSELSAETIVSMNFWGFSKEIMEELSGLFPEYLAKMLIENPMKGEALLPVAVGGLIEKGKVRVEILMSEDKWHGVTYMKDKDEVVSALQSMKDKGLYPEVLWE